MTSSSGDPLGVARNRSAVDLASCRISMMRNSAGLSGAEPIQDQRADDARLRAAVQENIAAHGNLIVDRANPRHGIGLGHEKRFRLWISP